MKHNIDNLYELFPKLPLGKRSIDIGGNKYGKLEVLYRTSNYVQPNGSWKSMWLCYCECGKYKPMMYSNLSKGILNSCGSCTMDFTERFDIKSVPGISYGESEGIGNTKHGQSCNPLFNTWSSVMNRCYNKNNSGYEYYGGKGIKVCERWLNLDNFINDNTPLYKDGLTIDRIDTFKDYSPENTRWITLGEQSINTGPKHWGKV